MCRHVSDTFGCAAGKKNGYGTLLYSTDVPNFGVATYILNILFLIFCKTLYLIFISWRKLTIVAELTTLEIAHCI
jgi:hypothetical protein